MATLKYANEPISEAFIRKSGLPAGAMSARVKMDEDPVDAIEEILPATISEVGIKIDENAAGLARRPACRHQGGVLHHLAWRRPQGRPADEAPRIDRGRV